MKTGNVQGYFGILPIVTPMRIQPSVDFPSVTVRDEGSSSTAGTLTMAGIAGTSSNYIGIKLTAGGLSGYKIVISNAGLSSLDAEL